MYRSYKDEDMRRGWLKYMGWCLGGAGLFVDIEKEGSESGLECVWMDGWACG